MNILYVAATPTHRDDGGLVRPKGRSLARHLSAQHEVRVCAGIAPPDSPVPASFMSADALDEFDIVYMEDGWDPDKYLVRLPLELAKSYVRRGGQLIVADVNKYGAKYQHESVKEAADLFGTSVRLGKVGRKKGVWVCYLYDEDQALYPEGHDGDRGWDLQWAVGTRFFASQMYVDAWLKPALEGIDSILARAAVPLEPQGADIAASGNANTAVMVEDVVLRGNRILTWASVNAYGLGHAVLIGADVSDDDLVDRCPDNARWISNLITVLTERSRETAGWTAPVQQQKPVSIPDLHMLISDASGAKFASAHYDDAVSAAFKAVERRVKTLTGSTKSGKPLMTQTFNEQSPTLDVAHDDLDEGQRADEAEGFKYLFMGAVQGLRNPRAHGADLQTDEEEAMEMLATASLLMRALDRAERRMD